MSSTSEKYIIYVDDQLLNIFKWQGDPDDPNMNSVRIKNREFIEAYNIFWKLLLLKWFNYFYKL